MDYYIMLPGQDADHKGPFNKQELAEMVKSGELSLDALYANEGMTEWQPLQQLLSSQPHEPSEPQEKPPQEGQTENSKPPMEPLAVLAGRWLGKRWKRLTPHVKNAWSAATTKTGDFIRTISCPPPGLTIEERLLHLERQNGALKWAGLFLILAFSIAASTFRQGNLMSTPQARDQIAIKDSAGKVRYWVGMTDTGDVAQQFYDQNGKERFSVNVFKNGLANERISDSEGNLRVLTYTSARAEAGQALFDRNKRMRIRSLVSEQGGSFLTFYDQNEIARSGMFTATDDSIGQWFGDRYGNNKVVTAINPDGSIVIPVPEESDGDKLWKWGDRALIAIGAAKLLNEWINSGK